MNKINKDTFIEIKNTFKRFISILLIVMLGVGFFAGIKAASPDMKKTIDAYYDNQNVMDLTVISTLGLTNEDINELKKIEEINEVIPSYSKDAIVKIDQSDIVVKINAIDDTINKIQIKEGRLPEKEYECVVEPTFLEKTKHNLNDTIEILEEDNKENNEFLKVKKMKIVGTATSPLYISEERGSSKIGSGKIDSCIYVPKISINNDIYTEAYITVAKAKELPCFSDEYDDIVEKVSKKIEDLAETRKEARYNEILDEANRKLKEAEDKLNEEKSKANEEIANAEKKILDAKSKIETSEKEIKVNETKANSEFSKAQKQIDNAKQELKSKEAELNKAKKEAEQQIGNFDNKISELNSKVKEVQQGIDSLKSNKEMLSSQKQQIEQQINNLKQVTQTEEIKQQINALENQLKSIEDNINYIDSQISTLNATISSLQENIAKIQNTKTELNKNEQILKKAKTDLNTQTNKLNSNKKTTSAKIEKAKKKLEKAKSEIQSNEAKLEEEKTKANSEIAKAESEIDSAKDKVNDIKRPDWYILDRNTNSGYVSYMQDTDRIANIGKVFPVVFFVVASLISLTAMTRMVEEQRTQIGTLKALGYKKIQIAKKYIIYSLLATAIGGIIGMCIGFQILPKIIFDMYRMMYTLPDIIIEFNVKYAVMGLGIAILCTCGATIYSCLKELNSVPAILMRPKSPRAGKRVLLEKITFIWSRLKFTQKVTMRNIFRYKKRFLMTIIGIGGCTSLIVAGFGLRDSISYMIPSQYGDIFKYQMSITFKNDAPREEINTKTKEISENNEITDEIKVNMQSIKIVKDNNNQNIQLIVPEDISKINSFIQLKNRKTNETYNLSNDAVIITEKLAKLLNIKVGDTITIENNDKIQKDVKVSACTENYLMHYIYMSPDVYKMLYNENVKYNTLLAKTNDMTGEQENDLAKEILSKDYISSVNFTSGTKNIFSEVMENMNLVVWILIISAGMLAFIVLYNLSNVNISERIRELATIKVLGFYDKEVYKYISRETVILTFIGIGLGLIAGYFLNLFIMQTCELDIMMFQKRVSIESYIYAILITTLFTVIVNIITYFSLKKIDMIESLKSVE